MKLFFKAFFLFTFYLPNFVDLSLENGTRNLDESVSSNYKINEQFIKYDLDQSSASEDEDGENENWSGDFIGDENRPSDFNILVDPLEYDDYEDYDIEEIRRYSEAPILSRKNDYNLEDKKMFKDFHNMYRSNQSAKTIPYFRDMEYLEWDNVMEWQAELWVDLCIMMKHGRPKEENSTYSQNLYFGPTHTPSRCMFLWYFEYKFYNFDELKCGIKKPTASITCGHFTCMMWAKSRKVGCARQFCVPRTGKYIVACHYIPEGNIVTLPAFVPGKPCNRCFSTMSGLCWKNLCVNERICKDYGLDCNCDVKCENCAVFNAPTCSCMCPDGWDGADCGAVCENLSESCLEHVKVMKPKKLCKQMQGQIKNEFCRKLCNTCRMPDPNKVYALCCDGVSCESGYALNKTDCSCNIECPGPLCVYGTTEEPAVVTAITMGLLPKSRGATHSPFTSSTLIFVLITLNIVLQVFFENAITYSLGLYLIPQLYICLTHLDYSHL